MATDNAPLLTMNGIVKSFNGVIVLDHVDFSVGRGETVALLGANGAGKSTLVKILSGVYSRDSGSLRIRGRECEFVDPAGAMRAGVRMLPQEISIIPDLTVEENICISDLPVSRKCLLPSLSRRAMRERALEVLGQLGMRHIKANRILRTMKLSDHRIIEIARAISGYAEILIMDEPTAALTEAERERLFEIIGLVKKRGVGVVYISHYLDEVFAIADRVAVLRDGHNAGDFVKNELRHEKILSAMLGRRLDQQYPERSLPGSEPAFAAKDFAAPGKIEAMSFQVAKGEIVGLHGLVGSGIEDFAKYLYGALRPWEVKGEFALAGSPYRPSSPEQANRRGMGFIPPDRKREGIIPDMSVRENITAPILNQFAKWGGLNLDRKRERSLVSGIIRDLGIRTAGQEQKIRFLSGGNQQKACLARWLKKNDLKFLIMQEPTYGVDVGARRDIYDLLKKLSQRGVGILAITTDVEEACGMSDRILILRRGKLAGEFPRGSTPGDIMHSATGASVVAGGRKQE